MSLKRLSKLDREYRVISRQIAASANTADVPGLKRHRSATVIEVREIIRKLDLPAPTWTRKKTRPKS